MQCLDNVKLSTRGREEKYRPRKSLNFYSSGEPGNKEILGGSLALALHRSAHFFGLFLFLVEFHILYPMHSVMLQPPTTHIPCILQ